MRVFHGRLDVVPKLRHRGDKSYYQPICRNENTPKCRYPCRTCDHKEHQHLTEELIHGHFTGKHILGVYPLHLNNDCAFIAADFDDHGGTRVEPLDDVKRLMDVASVQEFPLYALRSKSGKGYHVYAFFNMPVPAWKARIVMFALLQEAGVIGGDVELSSFDRLFPNQDSVEGLGNLIALPFQGNAAKDGHTLFLAPETGFTEPFANQWETLENLETVSQAKLNEIISNWDLKRETSPQAASHDIEADKTKLMQCKFVAWCIENPPRVSESLWYCLISNLITLRPGGVSWSHKASKGHPGYSKKECDRKILQALDRSGPHTCRFIKANGYDCGKDCGVKSPAGLMFRKKGETDGFEEIEFTCY